MEEEAADKVALLVATGLATPPKSSSSSESKSKIFIRSEREVAGFEGGGGTEGEEFAAGFTRGIELSLVVAGGGGVGVVSSLAAAEDGRRGLLFELHGKIIRWMLTR